MNEVGVASFETDYNKMKYTITFMKNGIKIDDIRGVSQYYSYNNIQYFRFADFKLKIITQDAKVIFDDLFMPLETYQKIEPVFNQFIQNYYKGI